MAEIHITRKRNWRDDPGAAITLDDWLNYIASDAEMRVDGFSAMDAPDGKTVRIQRPGLAVWLAYSKHGSGNTVCFSHDRDRISVKNPDKETIGKMHRIAQALGARVQGDDDKIYDAEGNPTVDLLRPKRAATPEPAAEDKKSWWKPWG